MPPIPRPVAAVAALSIAALTSAPALPAQKPARQETEIVGLAPEAKARFVDLVTEKCAGKY